MGARESQTKVVILTASYRIKGYIDVLPGARVTDYMLGAKGFIAVTDAEVWTIAGAALVLSAAFIDVSRDHIQMITLQELTQQSSSAAAGAVTVV
jgi:uncharacterized protein DUF6812